MVNMLYLLFCYLLSPCKKGFLLEQKNKTDLEIAKIFIQKDKIEKKVHNKKLEFGEFQDLKLEITNRNFKKN